MQRASITSTESFASRAQRSEAARVVLWTTVLLGMLLLTLARRSSGGVVMADGRTFFSYAGVLMLAILCQLVLFRALRRANRAGTLLPEKLWRATAIFDLIVAAALLAMLAFLSPRGAIPALSAPALLLLPLVVLTSVLCLRPDFTLIAGLAGALIHALLALRAIAVTDAAPESYPVYLAYSVILALTAVAGMFAARAVQAHVREAADEAAANRSAAKILRSIDESVCGFCAGSAQTDDMTAIVIKRTAPAMSPIGGSDARLDTDLSTAFARQEA